MREPMTLTDEELEAIKKHIAQGDPRVWEYVDDAQKLLQEVERVREENGKYEKELALYDEEALTLEEELQRLRKVEEAAGNIRGHSAFCKKWRYENRSGEWTFPPKDLSCSCGYEALRQSLQQEEK